MNIDPSTTYKLMILYMLNRVTFMMNLSQIRDFFLSKEYASYFTFQNTISDLLEAKLIEERKTKTTQKYSLTEDGITTLSYFENNLSDKIKSEIDQYIQDNKMKMKSESSFIADYIENQNNNFNVHLEIVENKDALLSIDLEMPDSETALSMCEKWKTSAQNIYNFIIKQLL